MHDATVGVEVARTTVSIYGLGPHIGARVAQLNITAAVSGALADMILALTRAPEPRSRPNRDPPSTVCGPNGVIGMGPDDCRRRRSDDPDGRHPATGSVRARVRVIEPKALRQAPPCSCRSESPVATSGRRECSHSPRSVIAQCQEAVRTGCCLRNWIRATSAQSSAFVVVRPQRDP